MLIGEPTHKKYDRRVKAGKHAGRVFRLVDVVTSKTIGDVVQLLDGPLVVAFESEFLTADGGKSFAQVESYLGSSTLEKLIGQTETDPDKVAALRLIYNEWKRRLESASTDSPPAA